MSEKVDRKDRHHADPEGIVFTKKVEKKKKEEPKK